MLFPGEVLLGVFHFLFKLLDLFPQQLVLVLLPCVHTCRCWAMDGSICSGRLRDHCAHGLRLLGIVAGDTRVVACAFDVEASGVLALA